MTLQEEALLRYPKGVKFNNSNILTCKIKDQISTGCLDNSGYELTDEILIITEGGGRFTVHKGGKWAGIVDFNYNNYLEVVNARYPIGSKYYGFYSISQAQSRNLNREEAEHPACYRHEGLEVGCAYVMIYFDGEFAWAPTEQEYLLTVQNQQNGRTNTSTDNVQVRPEPGQDRHPEECGSTAVCSRIRPARLGDSTFEYSSEPCSSKSKARRS